MRFPPPSASREEIAAFLREHAPPPEPPHEAPAFTNGPSPVCSACGIVRINIFAGPPFCKGCLAQMPEMP